MVFDVAAGEAAGNKLVFTRRFGCLGGGDDGTFKIGIAFDFDLVAIVAGNNAALFGDAGVIGFDFAFVVVGCAGYAIAYGYLPADVLLLAVVFGGVLQAFDVEFGGIDADAFAGYLCAFDVGGTATDEAGVAAEAADVAVAVAGFVAIGMAFAVVGSGGDAKGGTTRAVVDGYAGIPAAGLVFAAFAVALFGCQ
ncbi:hypothetical protein SALWKB12_0546 [Snodgrassella communis]|nr:hypothetical protein SALWKB12_2122 [Snodgrassella communis]KDN11801.1 hypothetical protein SALWKB12_1723 [Snodgrassella communis]KDN11976.1 hypothetical protein SALWKB12_1898 [Snodgrassella communis]KDN13691.1 hypothetical protein SALWKB12_0546 [Snodgrassella communis]